MEFKKILERYHISPLTYETGQVLEEADYDILLDMLLRYKAVDDLIKTGSIDTVYEKFKPLLQKAFKRRINSILPPTDEELVDIVMGKDTAEVL